VETVAGGRSTEMTSPAPSDSRRSIISGSVVTIASQAVVLVLSLLSQRIILSTLSKEENGDLFLVRRMVELFALLIIDVGFNPGTLREASRDSASQRVVLSTIAVYRVCAWLVVSGLLIAYEVATGANPTAVILWCCYLLIAGRSSLLRYLYEIPQRSAMKFGRPLLHGILDSALLTLGVYLFREELTPTVVLGIFAVSVMPGMLLQMSSVGWTMLSVRYFDLSVLRSHMRMAFPVWITVVLMVIHDRLDALMLSMLASKDVVGTFGAAYQMLVPFTTTLPVAAGSVLLPVVARLSQSHPERASTYVATVVRLLTATGLVVASVSTIYVPDMIRIMTNDVYADDVSVFSVLLWSAAPIFVVTYVIEAMHAYGHQRLNIRIVLSLAVSTVVVGVVLIPMMGAVGASITKLVSVAFSGVVAVALILRVTKRMLSWATVVRGALSLLLCVALALVMPIVVNRYVAGPVVLIGTTAIIVAMGLVRRSDLVLIFGARLGRRS